GDQGAADCQAEHALLPERGVRRSGARHLLLHAALIPQAVSDDEAAGSDEQREPRVAGVLRLLPEKARGQPGLHAGSRRGAPIQTPFIFPQVVEETSYNSGISWSPECNRFVFMSNGGEGNYDLYLREPDGRITRITNDKEKDGHAHWSPARDQIAFVSGRSG